MIAQEKHKSFEIYNAEASAKDWKAVVKNSFTMSWFPGDLVKESW